MPFNLGFRHTADKLAETKELADQLCANRPEESRTYMYSIVCLYRYVSLPYTVFAALFTVCCCHYSLSSSVLMYGSPRQLSTSTTFTVTGSHACALHCLCLLDSFTMPITVRKHWCICNKNVYAMSLPFAGSKQPAACKDAGPPVSTGCRNQPVARRFSTAT